MRPPGRLVAVICIALAAPAAGCGGDDSEDLEIAGIGPDTVVHGERDDGFAPNLNVTLEDGLPAGVTTSEYAKVTVAGLRDPVAAGFPPELVENIRNLQPSEISRPRDTELGGKPAALWYFTSVQNGRLVLVAALDEVRNSWRWN